MNDESKAIDAAVKECIEKGVLKDVLLKFRSEVVDMLLTEYDEVKTMMPSVKKDVKKDMQVA